MQLTPRSTGPHSLSNQSSTAAAARRNLASALTPALGEAPPSVRRSTVIQRVKKESKAWPAGVSVLKNLEKIVALNSQSPQMTGNYPQEEDLYAQMMSHGSEWGEKKSPYEGVNVGAVAVMDIPMGESLAFSFNDLGQQQHGMAQRMFDVFPDDVKEGGLVPIKSAKKDVLEHAEMELADSGRIPNGTYIGISKECCLCCAAALLVQGKYRFGGCHGEAFNQWRIPNFIRGSEEKLQLFLGKKAWKFYQGLTGGTFGVPLSMLDEITHKADFLTWLETAWGTLQKEL